MTVRELIDWVNQEQKKYDEYLETIDDEEKREEYRADFMDYRLCITDGVSGGSLDEPRLGLGWDSGIIELRSKWVNYKED